MGGWRDEAWVTPASSVAKAMEPRIIAVDDYFAGKDNAMLYHQSIETQGQRKFWNARSID